MTRFEALLEGFFYRPDEDVTELFQLSAGFEEAPPEVEQEAEAEYLAFRLADETYAVPIAELREIVKVPALTELPRAEPSLLGVMNVRGEVLPVYDLKLRLGLSSVPAAIAGPASSVRRADRKARVLIVRGGEGDAGVLVDSVVDVIRLRPSSIESPPAGVTNASHDWVVGLGRRKGQLFILLDVQRALE